MKKLLKFICIILVILLFFVWFIYNLNYSEDDNSNTLLSDDYTSDISAIDTHLIDINEHYMYIENSYQPYWGWQTYIKRAENGYYFISDDLLYFFDSETKNTTPLCSAIDCSHNDENCSAYLGDYGDKFEYGFIDLGFEVYDNNIYVLGYEQKEVCDIYVYRISMDGSERETYFGYGDYVYFQAG